MTVLTLTLSPTICRLTFLKIELFLGKSMGRGNCNGRMRKMLKALVPRGCCHPTTKTILVA